MTDTCHFSHESLHMGCTTEKGVQKAVTAYGEKCYMSLQKPGRWWLITIVLIGTSLLGVSIMGYKRHSISSRGT